MPDIKINGINIHYEEVGSGPLLILIMGLGADGSLWEQHVHDYKKHFRCIMPDNRGAGRSDKPEGPYTTRQMAEDIIGLMNVLGIEKTHVSGISMGGAIVQEMAINYPERIKSATIVSSWAKCDIYVTRIFEMFKETIKVSDKINFTRLLQLWIFSPEHHDTKIEDLLDREKTGAMHPYPMPEHAFLAQCYACIKHNTIGRLEDIKAPTLITVGDVDIFTPLKFSKEMADVIENNELLIITGGHTHHWETLEEFNAKTLLFLLANS